MHTYDDLNAHAGGEAMGRLWRIDIEYNKRLDRQRPCLGDVEEAII